MWEVDWAHPGNTGEKVWARSPEARIRKAREWHWTPTGYLRQCGINTPVYHTDSWEVDWMQRKDKLVWARNPLSKMPGAREWHWVDFHQLERSGVPWQPKRVRTGRWVSSSGYINLSSGGMTQEEVRLADEHKLWKGSWRGRCLEHQLVAVKKFGALPPGHCVRHLNGDKADNRPENLVLGTTKENCWDHETARRMAMFWRNRYEEAQREIETLRAQLRESI